MNLKAFKRSVSTVALLGSLAAANAQSMFDTFDSYSLGTVGGQGGWQGWTGLPTAGNVSTVQAFSGTQSLQVVAGNDTVRPFSGVNSGQWTLSLKQYVPSTSSGSTWIITMNSYPSSLNWSAQVLTDISQGLVGVFDGAGNQSGPAVPLLKDQWVDIRFEINLTANSVSSFYNNALLGTSAWQLGGINQLQALDIYPDESTGTAQIGSVFYDNVRLAQVPEPGTLSLLALGGLAAFYRFRKLA